MSKPKEFWIFPQKGNDCEWTNLYPDESWKSGTKPLIHVREVTPCANCERLEEELLKLSGCPKCGIDRRYDLHDKIAEIDKLKKQIEMCRKTLKRISEDRCVDVSGKVTKFETWTAELARECLFKLEEE